MSAIKLAEVDELVKRLNGVVKESGPYVSLVGSIKIEELGIDLGFNNRDCTGACNTSCSGCSACSGCSGCSSTSSSTSFHPGDAVSNPNPLEDPVGQLVASLRDPAVRATLLEAARAAGG